MNYKSFILTLIILTSILTIRSCYNRKIVYSGFNDLFVGSQSFILYDDSTFYLEMGAGGAEGTYQMRQDVVKLDYINKPGKDWPEIMLICKDYFIGNDSLDSAKYLKIKRDK